MSTGEMQLRIYDRRLFLRDGARHDMAALGKPSVLTIQDPSRTLLGAYWEPTRSLLGPYQDPTRSLLGSTESSDEP